MVWKLLAVQTGTLVDGVSRDAVVAAGNWIKKLQNRAQIEEHLDLDQDEVDQHEQEEGRWDSDSEPSAPFESESEPEQESDHDAWTDSDSNSAFALTFLDVNSPLRILFHPDSYPQPLPTNTAALHKRHRWKNAEERPEALSEALRMHEKALYLTSKEGHSRMKAGYIARKRYRLQLWSLIEEFLFDSAGKSSGGEREDGQTEGGDGIRKENQEEGVAAQDNGKGNLQEPEGGK